MYADEKGKLVVTAALERLAVWDCAGAWSTRRLIPGRRRGRCGPTVTKIARAPGSSLVAAGAADVPSDLWNLEDGTSDVMLKGHKSEVTALRFNASGSLLVSGGKDTNVVVWDVVAETGLCRLRGHKDQVTDAAFVETMNPDAQRLRVGGRAAGHLRQGRRRARLGPRHAALRADARALRRGVLEP